MARSGNCKYFCIMRVQSSKGRKMITKGSEDVSRDNIMLLCTLCGMRRGLLRKRPYQFKRNQESF